MSVLKFYVPEWWENWSTETIIDNILQQIESSKLLDQLISIQRYREHVELYVKKPAAAKYLEMKVNVDGVFFYFVAKEENVLVINIYGLELDTDWTNVVHAMSKFGSPIHYYELKRNWNGKNIKTGVRCIWIKNINVVPPDIIKQGDRQITFKETVTMRSAANDVEEGRLKTKSLEPGNETGKSGYENVKLTCYENGKPGVLENNGKMFDEIREAEILKQQDESDMKKPEKASHAILKIASNMNGDHQKIRETHLDVSELSDVVPMKCAGYPKKEKLPTPNQNMNMSKDIPKESCSPALITSTSTIPISILKNDKNVKYKDDMMPKGHV